MNTGKIGAQHQFATGQGRNPLEKHIPCSPLTLCQVPAPPCPPFTDLSLPVTGPEKTFVETGLLFAFL